MNSSRTCGDCTACCRTHKVPEIKKETGQLCRFCSGKGCGIYSKRPRSCQDFKCQWLIGFGEEEDRPDKSGRVLDFRKGKPWGRLLMIWEAGEGQFPNPNIWLMTREILNRGWLVVHIPLSGTRKLFLPGSVRMTKMLKKAASLNGFIMTEFPVISER